MRDTGLLRLEEAVRKMTSMPAIHFGLGRRGLLGARVRCGRRGLRPRTPRHAGHESAEPAVYAEGVEHVLVNGAAVLDDGRHTGARSGRPLLRA